MSQKQALRLVIDGVFFQIGRSGIARVWQKIFEHWIRTGFSEHVVVLDRAGTLPRMPGLITMSLPGFDYAHQARDRLLLQQACDAAGATVFMSTYYTMPVYTPSLMMVHDMIPEVLQWNLDEPMWRQKQEALQYASGYLAVSHNTASDLQSHLAGCLNRTNPDIQVARAGCDFRPAPPEHVEELRHRLGLERPYFMLSGTRTDYKNAALFFEAFANLGDERAKLSVLCTGGGDIDPAFIQLAGPAEVRGTILNDYDMMAAYSGALALVYPSRYEGFGLPVLEAMACGAPVICSNAASLPEVGGPAPLYIDLEDQAIEQLTEQLRAVQHAQVREERIALGLIQAASFSWASMAEHVMRRAQHLHDELHPDAATQQRGHLTRVGRFAQWLPSTHDIESARREHPLFTGMWRHLARSLPAHSEVWDLEAGHGELLALISSERSDLHLTCHELDARAMSFLDINLHRMAHELQQAPVVLSRHQVLDPALTLRDQSPTPAGCTWLRVCGESGALESEHAAAWLQALQPDIVQTAYRGGAASAPQRAVISQLPEWHMAQHWVFDNYGNLMLQTASIEAVLALCDYLDRQANGHASRSIYQLDILSCRDEACAVCHQAATQHLSREHVLVPESSSHVDLTERLAA